MNATEPGAIGETGAAHQLVTSGQVLAGYFIAVFSVVSVVFSFLLPAEMGGDTAYIAQNSIACVIGLIIGASLIRGVVGAVSWAKLLLVFGMIIALFQAVAGGHGIQPLLAWVYCGALALLIFGNACKTRKTIASVLVIPYGVMYVMAFIGLHIE